MKIKTPSFKDIITYSNPTTASAAMTPKLKELWDTAIHGGKTGNPGDLAKEQGMQEYLDAIKKYEETGNNQYSWLGDLEAPPQLGGTEFDKISSDPKLRAYEMQALADLEQQSKDGLSLRDQADLARLEGQVNRQNAGRTGAIQQSMAARGMGGSGLELVAQMQANQDATERQALASLEKAAMAQEGRRDATSRLGMQAGNMSARDHAQAAQRAAAQDAINRFNVANQYRTQMYNHQGQQGIANQNVNQNNQFAQNVLGAKQGGAQMTYNAGTEANNQATARRQQKQAENMGWVNTAFNGAKAAGSLMGMSNGGTVPGQASLPGDHPANDTQPAMLSPGEVVLPRSVANEIPGSDPVQAIAELLARTKQTVRK